MFSQFVSFLICFAPFNIFPRLAQRTDSRLMHSWCVAAIRMTKVLQYVLNDTSNTCDTRATVAAWCTEQCEAKKLVHLGAKGGAQLGRALQHLFQRPQQPLLYPVLRSEHRRHNLHVALHEELGLDPRRVLL